MLGLPPSPKLSKMAKRLKRNDRRRLARRYMVYPPPKIRPYQRRNTSDSSPSPIRSTVNTYTLASNDNSQPPVRRRDSKVLRNKRLGMKDTLEKDTMQGLERAAWGKKRRKHKPAVEPLEASKKDLEKMDLKQKKTSVPP